MYLYHRSNIQILDGEDGKEKPSSIGGTYVISTWAIPHRLSSLPDFPTIAHISPPPSLCGIFVQINAFSNPIEEGGERIVSWNNNNNLVSFKMW